MLFITCHNLRTFKFTISSNPRPSSLSPKLYVNGVLDGQATASAAPGTGLADKELYLGQSGSLSLGGSDIAVSQALLDEISLWSRADVVEPAVFEGSEAGLLAYYRCDDGAGAAMRTYGPRDASRYGSVQTGASFVSPDHLERRRRREF